MLQATGMIRHQRQEITFVKIEEMFWSVIQPKKKKKVNCQNKLKLKNKTMTNKFKNNVVGSAI